MKTREDKIESGLQLPVWLSGHKSVIALFVVLSLVLRFQTFFPFYNGRDEATYLVIANGWLNGGIPFVDFIDIKPIGIYALFATVTFLFGKSFIAVRIVTSLAVALTGYFLYRAKHSYDKNKYYAVLIGGIYIAFMSIHSWGWSANTEMFFVFFTALGLWQMQHIRSKTGYVFFGLIMGLGFVFKYHILFDALALGLYLLFDEGKSLSRRILGLSLAAMTFALPFMTCILVYYAIGHLNEFIYASFEIPSRYHFTMSFGKKLEFIGQFYAYFLPFALIYGFSIYTHLRRHRYVLNKENILFVLWPILVWVAILLTGKRFWHYYVQALIPFCFFMLDGLMYSTWPWKKTLRRKLVSFAVVVLLVIPIGKQYIEIGQWSKSREEIFAFLKEEIQPNDHIYTSDATMLYYLLDRPCPTKFIHETLIFDPNHIKAFGVDQQKEFENIMLSEPKYVVTRNGGKLFLVNWLRSNYRQLKEFPDGLSLWQRN